VDMASNFRRLIVSNDRMSRVDVLDHGYVRLVGVLGDDLTVVNAARVSFEKESDHLSKRDTRLLRYLAEHNHTSPCRHAVLSFEVYAPMMVMRQWGKYRVGSVWSFEDSDDPIETWNESSRRYVTEEPRFYVPRPEQWRSAPENKKQGSGDPISDESTTNPLTDSLDDIVGQGLRYYNMALERGVCAEQARLFLPAYAMYIRARWTVSLHGVIHFLQQRLHEDAQWEIREYARAVYQLAQPKFPESFAAFGLTEGESECTSS